MAEKVEIFEMGPRDGLQNESAEISVEDKVRLVDLLSEAGFSKIETGSFVSPKWVPQMADSGAVFAQISRRDGVAYTGLTPNMRGYEASRVARVDEVAIFGAATEGFSRANLNATRAEALAQFEPVCEAAQADRVPVRGYVSCVTVCPYDGAVDPGEVARIAEALFNMGCYEVSLGDTVGRGVPEQVDAMLAAVLDVAPATRLAGHYHDTNGRALDNIDVSLARGLRVFDAAVGGLGGCPYAPGAKGNVATEAVDARLTALGYFTGLDRQVLGEAALFAQSLRSAA